MADPIDLDAARDAPRRPAPPEPLWREVLGERMRELRADRGTTLIDTARRAGISPQYLSELERGRKDPSSEMIAAVAGSLGTSVADLTGDVARELHRRRATEPRSDRRSAFALAA